MNPRPPTKISQGADHETQPSSTPARPQPISETGTKLERLDRELVWISLGFVLLIGVAGAFLTGTFRSEPKSEPLAPSWLRIGEQHLVQDRLTHPPGDNALEAYLNAKALTLGSSVVDRGLQAIATRYQELINNLLEHQDLALAAETLEAAARVVPHAPPEYSEALASARARLEEMTQQMALERQSARSTTETYEPLTVFQDYLKDGSLGPKLVVVPSGGYVIGSPDSEPDRDADEGPRFFVSVGSFAIGQTEVTFAEYDRFADAVGWAKPGDGGWGRAQRPAINVSWLEARAYAAWLSLQTGFDYRLPAEAEWEHAARAGTTSPYIEGDCLSPEKANVDFRTGSEVCPETPVNIGRTLPTGALEPNPWGVYDLSGNVREWVLDCWEMAYHPIIADGSPYYSAEGGSCGLNGNRGLRGGSWNAPMTSARTANRYAMYENNWNLTVGIRLVRELD